MKKCSQGSASKSEENGNNNAVKMAGNKKGTKKVKKDWAEVECSKGEGKDEMPETEVVRVPGVAHFHRMEKGKCMAVGILGKAIRYITISMFNGKTMVVTECGKWVPVAEGYGEALKIWRKAAA